MTQNPQSNATSLMSDDKPESDQQHQSSSINSEAVSRKKAYKLHNISSRSEAYDTLHNKAIENISCMSNVCTGSIVRPATTGGNSSRTASEILRHAKDFLDQFYSSIKRLNSDAHCSRWHEMQAQVTAKGTYELTETELVYGAKLAWRNAQRCIGRIQWARLQVFDARFVSNASGMFEALCNHIRYATNKGNIRSAITVFPQRTDGLHDYRIWNAQLISYAGYQQPDGSIIGDPQNVEFTEVCQKLGWKGKEENWDILPLVLSANGDDPECFVLPEDIVLQVPLHHPKYGWFEDLNLRWYALPAVSNMLFDVGGIEFTAAPFNGWYMETEIGCRNLADSYRYNVIEKVAMKMGLDTSANSTLWKDKTLVEVNVAVLHSFQTMNVTVVDHHTASESFMKHLEKEQRLRGGCPADWVWIVPPLSGSLTPVFHQEMLTYHLKPCYEYQDSAWRVHKWKKTTPTDGKGAGSVNRKFRFKEIARAVKFTSNLFGKALSRRVKATILYATETGKSENFARMLAEMFNRVFNTHVFCMSEYDIIHLEHETLLLVVTSTFGNGDPPENGEEFAQNLYAMNESKTTQKDETSRKQSRSFIKMNSQSRSSVTDSNSPKSSIEDVGPLGNLRFAVFGLGSSAYPNFCAFGKYVDHLLAELGGERILCVREGDEICGQEQQFRNWATNVFQVACEVFCVGDGVSFSEVFANLGTDALWAEGKLRIIESNENNIDIAKGLTKLLNKPVTKAMLISRQDLTRDSSQKVILVRLATGTSKDLTFIPGDHIAICPINSQDLVDGLIQRLKDNPLPEKIINVEVLKEEHTPNEVLKKWVPHDRLSSCTLRMAVARFLDITSPPTAQLLELFATLASDEIDQQRLNRLAADAVAYEEWKRTYFPNLVEVLDEFPSIVLDSCILLSSLPPLQPRFYSISSSPRAYWREIHLTVGVLSYQIRDRVHHGVASGYLNTAPEGSTIYCFIRTAPNFHLPADTSTPIIMVGPGTGIAPFRSFWQEEEFLQKNEKTGRHMSLFFGCRNPQSHLYADETIDLKAHGVFQHVFTAYSRLLGQPKVYVQKLLQEAGSMVLQAIYFRGGHFYVCGNVEMAEEVCITLRWVLEHFGGLTCDQANNYVHHMRDENRYHEDIFGVTFRRNLLQDGLNNASDD